ncbi:molybdopterin molybdotransferase MoeA [Halocalculus aciditolerans]|uniref:Molybdopterin molybdenumtransferase MoeA n=1 Tax=Halocalculus aciditolerans TaxID=1383812 RepID=A0A830FLL4_9EURY|nr:molybdopterin molybdotransferase MoeA [Halocalculus aciditolerans]GGL67744.1 molybdopterin molybdenumtransferase MoeA [Halocalculus aciditolerans]
MADHPDLVTRDRAVGDVLAARESALASRDTETVPPDEIGGRVLAEDVVADADAPPVSRATMDGFAFDATDDYPLTLGEGEVFPEDDPGDLDAGHARRVATGAPIPRGANAVLKREDARVSDGRLRGKRVEPGTYVSERGSNYAAGDALFAAGERLSAKDAILLGDLGVDDVAVFERFSVGVLATGTEIHEGVTADLDSDMLAGLVESWGHDAVYEGSVPDEGDRVRDAIESLAREHDVVVTTGGTSVGHKDYVVRALADLGEIDFHRVRLRPGKPLALARLPEHDAVAFAVPGKPVGAHTVATLVARPFFTGDARHPTVSAEVTVDLELGPSGFDYAIPVTLDGDRATPLGHASSALAVYEDTYDPSVLSASTRATRADGLVVTTDALTAGERVEVVPYSVLD